MTDSKIYTIYGLRIIGKEMFFYIGVTADARKRLKQHFSYAKLEKNTDSKCTIIRESNYTIELIAIEEFRGSRKEAEIKEKAAIKKFLGMGHPLVNIHTYNKTQISATISRSNFEYVAELAQKRNKSFSQTVEYLLELYLDNYIPGWRWAEGNINNLTINEQFAKATLG